MCALRGANNPPVPPRTGGRTRNASIQLHLGVKEQDFQIAWVQSTAGALCLGMNCVTAVLLHAGQRKRHQDCSHHQATPAKKKQTNLKSDLLTLRSQGTQNMHSPKKR